MVKYDKNSNLVLQCGETFWESLALTSVFVVKLGYDIKRIIKTKVKNIDDERKDEFKG